MISVINRASMSSNAAPRRQPSRRNARMPPAEESQDSSTTTEAMGTNHGDSETHPIGTGSEDAALPEPVSPGRPKSTPSGTTPTPTVASSPGRPVKRLDSLRRRNPSETSSASGGAIAKSVGLKFQPKSFIRRSKEEREAQERAEAEKRQAKGAATVGAGSSIGIRGVSYGRGRGRGLESRDGGMNRFKSERHGMGQASGPLGGGNIPTEMSWKRRGGMGDGEIIGTTRATYGSFGKDPSVKSENADGDWNISSTSTARRPKVKREDEGVNYISSDDDQREGPRVNIEHINLISDEESDEDPIPTKGKSREHLKGLRTPVWALKPVRLDRQEHVERAVGVNTEASSLTSAELRKRAKDKSDAEGSLFLPLPQEKDTETKEAAKNRGKGKDVEFVRDERRWKGVYEDEDDLEEAPQIKEEPVDAETGDVMTIDIPDVPTPVIISHPTKNFTSSRPPSALTQPPVPSDPTSKPIRRRKSLSRLQKPILQTDEDRAEWARHEEGIQIITSELGAIAALLPSSTSKPAKLSDPNAIDLDDSEAKAADNAKDRKDGLVYLFQLPPLVPALRDQTIKTEAASRTDLASGDVVETSYGSILNPTSFPSTTNGSIKLDPDGPGPETESKDPFVLEPSDIAVPATGGVVGELFVFGDGECIVSWGGAESGIGFLLGRGGEGALLREVVIADLDLEGQSQGGAAGSGKRDGWAVGGLGGGFVVTPDWAGMFEGK